MCEYDTSTPLRKLLYTAPKVLYLVTLIILCVLYANLKTRDPTFDSPDSRILQKIFANVHQLPINDIQIPTTTNSCPSDFTAVDLGSWSGTAAGCKCTTSLLNRTCTSDDTGCTNVPAVPSQSFKTWKTSQLCIKRVTATTEPEGGSTCGTGYNLCAATGVCVADGEKCPITDIMIVEKATTIDETTYSWILLNDEASKIIFTSTKEDKPITDIAISLYDEPCMDPLQQPYSKEKTPYALSVIPESGCKRGGPIDHLENIDKMSMATLFGENSMTNTPSGYDTYISDESAYLVGLRQYTVNSDNSLCGNTDPTMFAENYKYEDQFMDSTHAILITALVIMSILFFTIIIELCLRFRSNEEETHILKYAAYGNFFLLFIACCLFIVAGSFSARAKVHLSSDIKYLKYLAKNDCFDQPVVNLTLELFKEYITDLYTLIWLGIILLILSSTGLLSSIILFIIDACAGGRKIDPSSFYKAIGKSTRRGNLKRDGTAKTGGKTVGNIELLLKQ